MPPTVILATLQNYLSNPLFISTYSPHNLNIHPNRCAYQTLHRRSTSTRTQAPDRPSLTSLVLESHLARYRM
ncbi:hypothetical protein I7I48_02886 [Histoplasma ohiense]|nr:hypothetical protein I7I48_02886 [Histoplasma ohiense (nom. inval.)]